MDLFQKEAVYDPVSALRTDPNVKEFLFLNEDMAIKSSKTTYSDVFFDVADEFDDDIQVVGFEHVLDPNHANLVHHFVLTAHKDSDDNVGTTIWPWASGVQPFAFPSNTGFLMGKSALFTGLNMNTHFDNPEGLSGLKDNSGIRIFYVEKEHFREHEVGIIQIGDPSVLMSQVESKLPVGASKFSISCPGTCTETFLNNSITLISAQLHMHAVGDAIKVEHTRAGEVLNTFKTEYYDYAFQDIVPASEAAGVVVQPGDGFDIECVYKTNEQIYFGPESHNEMCISFIMYYPKLSDINECGINPGVFFEGDATSRSLTPPRPKQMPEFNDDDVRRMLEEAAHPRELACSDNLSLLSSYTGGYMETCVGKEFFCLDDGILVEFGMPEGLFASTLCCGTCEEVVASGNEKCEYEDGLISMFTDNAIPDCSSFSFLCENDDTLVESGSPPGFFSGVCCKTCNGIPYVLNEEMAACLGDFEMVSMDDTDEISFRTFGGNSGQCVELHDDEEGSLLLTGGSKSATSQPAIAAFAAAVVLAYSVLVY
jgi:hypothetical protein